MADKGYEERDVAAGKIWIFSAAAFAAGLLASIFLVWGLMVYWGHHPFSTVQSSPTALPGMEPPPPVLQSDETLGLDRYLTGQDQVLGAYEWKDRGAGTVRIPIDRAMEILAERGLPERSGNITPLEMQRQKALEAKP